MIPEVKEELGADIKYLKQGQHVRWSRRRPSARVTPNKSLERTR
jgi:hypothetical protein